MQYEDFDQFKQGQHVLVHMDPLWRRLHPGIPIAYQGVVESGGPGRVFVLRVGDMLHTFDPRIVAMVEVIDSPRGRQPGGG